MSKLDKILDKLENLEEEVKRRFDGVDQNTVGLSQRIDNLDEEMLKVKHAVRGLGLEFEKFRSEQRVQKEVLLELRNQNLGSRLTALEKRAF